MSVRDRRVAAAMMAYLVGLHLVVLISLWRRSEGGVAGGVAMLSLVPVALALRYLLSRVVRPLGPLDLWVVFYGAWSLGSGVLYLQTGNPSQPAAFAYGVYSFVLPMACYFAARAIPKAHVPLVVSGIVLLNAFTAGYGLYMHFVRPDYYADFVMRAFSSAGATEDWQFYARLQSYLGSTVVGYVSACGIVLATISQQTVRRSLPVLVLVFVAATLLSLQRASILGLAVAILYLILVSRGNGVVRAVTLLLLVSALAYGGAMAARASNPISDRVQTRVTDDLFAGFSRFFDERGYRPGLAYLSDFPMGVGLGGTSSAADNAGLLSRDEVADANFMRIAADLGPLGLLLFLLVVGAAARVAWRGEHRYAWMAYLTIHCGIMLSTNVLDSYYISQSFWLLLGLLATDAERGDALPTRLGVSMPAVA